MRIRCKFRCDAVEKVRGWGDHRFLWSAKFSAVGKDDSEENKAFWAATPAGSLTVTSILHDAFEVWDEYYVDIIPTEATAGEAS